MKIAAIVAMLVFGWGVTGQIDHWNEQDAARQRIAMMRQCPVSNAGQALVSSTQDTRTGRVQCLYLDGGKAYARAVKTMERG
jgi:hypothetical protein